jgi:hypothetical protein
MSFINGYAMVSRDEDDHYFCHDCLPDSVFIGELTHQFYLAHDQKKDQYWIGDITCHGGKDDIVWRFPIKPEKDPMNLVDEPEDEESPLWDQNIEWIRNIEANAEFSFKFEPTRGHEITESFLKAGWNQDDHGYLLLYIFHNAAVLIEQYEQRNK